MSQGQRKLAAIMFTDMVGFTALTQSEESQALKVLERHNRLLRPFFQKFSGREVKAIGDSFLVEFESALDATDCAIEIQKFLHDYNTSSRDEWKITLRIGIHLGDVVRSAGDVLGDAVNIASRLQPLADPEGVCLSDAVFGQVRNKIPYALVKMAPRDLKNVSSQIEVYRLVMPWDKEDPTSKDTGDARRIAVLPFANLSPDPNDLYFADGITEEIISTASSISGLSVISRTSVMGYKGTTKRVEEIGRELRVGSVLEGSFRKAGNRIRVTTQLIDVAGDRHLWAESYDKDLDDVFAVQSDIARRVAEALRVRILNKEAERVERKPTASTKAYTLYLKGRSHWNRRDADEVKEAIAALEEAVADDRNFALGYVGLADCYRAMATNFGIDRAVNMERGASALARALELEPELAEALASEGLNHLANYRAKEAEEELNRAASLKPSYASAHHWHSLVMLTEMRLDEALRSIERAVELDPLSPILNQQLAYVYQVRGDYERALEMYGRAVELDPAFAIVRFFMFDTYLEMKRPADALKEAKKGLQLQQTFRFYDEKMVDAIVAASEGDRATTRGLLPGIESRIDEPGVGAYGVARLHFMLGDDDRGFEWMERAFQRREWYLLFARNHRFLDRVRDDPRYRDIVTRLGVG